MKHPTLWTSKPSVARLFYNHLEPLLACVCTGIAAEAREASFPIIDQHCRVYLEVYPFSRQSRSPKESQLLLGENRREQLSWYLMIPDSRSSDCLLIMLVSWFILQVTQEQTMKSMNQCTLCDLKWHHGTGKSIKSHLYVCVMGWSSINGYHCTVVFHCQAGQAAATLANLMWAPDLNQEQLAGRLRFWWMLSVILNLIDMIWGVS